MAALLLFGLTVASSILFYRRIRKAQLEYEEAKDIVRSIVLSFSGQLSRQKRDLRAVDSRSELALEKSNQAPFAYRKGIFPSKFALNRVGDNEPTGNRAEHASARPDEQ